MQWEFCSMESAIERSTPSAAGIPTTWRKLAFWILIGMFSVVFVEVPAGSTMFPFFTIWGILVVLPLYLLHSVLLGGLVFRFGRPVFWTLLAAGMLYGMYEAYITKVLWVSFRPEGPIFTVAGIALFETILLVMFLHPMLAFVVPLLFLEALGTRSDEIAAGLPIRVQNAVRSHPRLWIGLLMAFLGFMQFVNSPSVAASLASGATNSFVVGLALLWWRRSGGTSYTFRELLPGDRGLKIFGFLLLVWYAFWGFAIRPNSIPSLANGQLTVWLIYAVLLVVFVGALRQSCRSPIGRGACRPLFTFTWRGFVLACGVATAVTATSRLVLFPWAGIQVLLMFSFYVITGLILFIGAVRYSGVLGGIRPRGSPRRSVRDMGRARDTESRQPELTREGISPIVAGQDEPGSSDGLEHFTIERAELIADDSRVLIDSLDAELSGIYPEPGATHFHLDPAEVADGRGVFLVVYRGKTPVGCGALRLRDAGTAELKRMYVTPTERGKGLGRRLVAALETEARALGVQRLILETGVRQAAALALYQTAGFGRIPLYGEYCLSPETSICLGKELRAQDA